MPILCFQFVDYWCLLIYRLLNFLVLCFRLKCGDLQPKLLVWWSRRNFMPLKEDPSFYHRLKMSMETLIRPTRLLQSHISNGQQVWRISGI
ncbi:hypothetical protein Patl1_11251 [Pistacia atlantica]|uniref:Uncharacterized protein n=1 Tax=Pistacia atlantica TaxID=434234 RepID=A0ACC1A6U6_9ROSI|nr:hypothetical protein Patl1_11251 [Pistacia atlantica]